MDGTGNQGVPNSSISRSITLPAEATTLCFLTAPHNRPGADAALRVRLVDGATTHVLLDWEELVHDGEDGGDLRWIERTASVAAYAGRTVELHFEQDDNGPGTHEQRYLDDIVIAR